ncbi:MULTISPECIES: sigma-54-dependent transcriptional regulator [Methylotenera]|uniref:sigma-54-dependent transcriptional regulator n=1 Tax=Methylotenera TaxID=359407 RepID=UPI00036B352F|nr:MULTISPECIES: sigma-54 dependent transcriptional regulator [Methylotenera]
MLAQHTQPKPANADSEHLEQSTHFSQSKKILIVEDEVLFARAVQKRLQKAGFECEHVESLADARAIIKQFNADLVLLDMRLPDGNGLDLLSEFVAKNMTTIVMTAYGEVSDAVNAMKLGANDYLKKPIDLEELLLIVQKNEKTSALQTSLDYARQRNAHSSDGITLIGDSPATQSIHMQIARIAQLGHLGDSIAPTVLITGETGTGKDVAARLLHASGSNSEKPFVHVDCASLPNELIESELFGHEKGAFTNAVTSRPGLIEAAEDGTLFLDEIGELPLALQAKLLSVLERRRVRRLGSTKERIVPARIVAATNRNLHEMSQAGRFRSDLYYRLNVMTISLAPLRERGGDILQLAKHFMQLTEKRYGLTKHQFSQSAVDAMQTYKWPGNVRELRHQISRAVLLSSQAQISASDLNLNDSKNKVANDSSKQSQVTLDAAEKTMLLKALESAHNNVSEAARQLGITRMTMRYRMDKHGISF